MTSINIKYCKKCKKPYDYSRCPYCEWTTNEKKKEIESGRR